jgi:hypothetical protein
MKFQDFETQKYCCPEEISTTIVTIVEELESSELDFLRSYAPQEVTVASSLLPRYVLLGILFNEVNVEAFIASPDFSRNLLRNYSSALNRLGIEDVSIIPISIPSGLLGRIFE